MRTIEELKAERIKLQERLKVVEEEMRKRFECGCNLKVGDIVECRGQRGIIRRLLFNNLNDTYRPNKIIWQKIKANGELYKYTSELHMYSWKEDDLKIIKKECDTI